MTVKEFKGILNKQSDEFLITFPASLMTGVTAFDDGDGIVILPTGDMKTVGELLKDLSRFDDGDEIDDIYLWLNNAHEVIYIDESSDWDDGIEKFVTKLN